MEAIFKAKSKQTEVLFNDHTCNSKNFSFLDCNHWWFLVAGGRLPGMDRTEGRCEMPIPQELYIHAIVCFLMGIWTIHTYIVTYIFLHIYVITYIYVSQLPEYTHYRRILVHLYIYNT